MTAGAVPLLIALILVTIWFIGESVLTRRDACRETESRIDLSR